LTGASSCLTDIKIARHTILMASTQCIILPNESLLQFIRLRCQFFELSRRPFERCDNETCSTVRFNSKPLVKTLIRYVHCGGRLIALVFCGVIEYSITPLCGATKKSKRYRPSPARSAW
jgi:hypothetical protein